MDKLRSILTNAAKFGYIKADLVDRNILDRIKFLPLGNILRKNIETLWSKSNNAPFWSFILESHINSNNLIDNYSTHILDARHYIKTEKFRENFLFVKNEKHKETPMCIKEILVYKNNMQNAVSSESKKLFANFKEGSLLNASYFVSEQSAIENFFKIQRERKIWWMKISSNPGRYFWSDLQTDGTNDKIQSVGLKSKFSFGEIDVENLTMYPLKSLELENLENFYLKDSQLKRRITPVVLRTEFSLEAAVLNLIFDAAEDGNEQKMVLHRKISPYQCSVFCISEDPKILTELTDLADYLKSVLSHAGIVALSLSKCIVTNKNDLQNEFGLMDRFGVPYGIILDESSLLNGLLRLRSRDTTISEIIHIADLPNYLLKIVSC